MKKRIVILLCASVLTLNLTAAPAMASAGPFHPIEVEAYTYGPLDEPRVNKVYQLSATDDPSGIPTEDFERGGRRYYLLDMSIANTDHETVTYTAIFGSVELAKATGPQALDGTDDSLGLLLVLSCVGGVIMVAANIIHFHHCIRDSPCSRHHVFTDSPLLRHSMIRSCHLFSFP